MHPAADRTTWTWSSSKSAAPWATSRACPSSRPSASFERDVGKDNVCLHSRDPGALHRDLGRSEDQAHPAQRQGTAQHRHPARHPALPHRAVCSPGISRARSPMFCNVDADARHNRPGRGKHLRGAPALPQEGLDEKIVKLLNIWTAAPRLDDWERLVPMPEKSSRRGARSPSSASTWT